MFYRHQFNRGAIRARCTSNHKSVRYTIILLLALLLPRANNVAAQHTVDSNTTHGHVGAHSHHKPHDHVTTSRIETNNNHKSGGKLVSKEFALNLEARMGQWFPDGPKGDSLEVAAFGEIGKAALVPGPMIRVPLGTTVRVAVRNTLTKPLTMFGLDTIRGANADSVQILPNATHIFEFRASQVGTFYYAGKTTRAPLVARHLEDSQLNGVIIVDSSLNVVPRANDQAFLISWWYMSDTTSPNGLARATMAINGRSWPHTESLQVTQGDSLRWRWINLTLLSHPMHLHGFYYRIDGAGNGTTFQSFADSAKREVVTEMLGAGATMQITWSPTRSGNWIFHCHMASHMSHHVALGTVMGVPSVAAHAHARETSSSINTNPDLLTSRSTLGDAEFSAPAALTHEMAGLVLGIRVKPKAFKSVTGDRSVKNADTVGERKLRLFVRSRDNVFKSAVGYAYSLHENAAEDSIAFGRPGPTLVLQQNQPVAITIVNQSSEGAAVHWHGIELESFPDGVPGWSGMEKSLLPAIAPGDSLKVRFTPPRVGTFMYHSHFNEFEQIASGLHGAIVVLPPGAKYEKHVDRIMMFSDDGPTKNLLAGPYPLARLNGELNPTLEFKAGVTYRLRFINIRTDYVLGIKLSGGVEPVRWRVIAKDGRDLLASQAKEADAQLRFAPGEIYDVEFTPTKPGIYTLEHRMSELPPPLQMPTYLEVRVK